MLLLIGTIVLAIGWLIRQIQRAISREPLNVPKYLLLAAAIPMHWVALVTPMPAKPIALVAILTIYHNLQYHRLIWFHNQKYRYAGVSPAGARDARVPQLRPRGSHQSPADFLHRVWDSVRHHLPGTAPIPGLPQSAHRRFTGGALDADPTGHRLSLGLRLYSLLPRFENLARAERSGGGQGSQDELEFQLACLTILPKLPLNWSRLPPVSTLVVGCWEPAEISARW